MILIVYRITTDLSFSEPMSLSVIANNAEEAARLFYEKYPDRKIKHLEQIASEVIMNIGEIK